MKRREVWTVSCLQSEWTSQPCPFPYIALHPGLCHVFTGVLRIRQFWIWRVMTSQILGSWFVREIPGISDLRSLNWASRSITTPATAKERRTSSGRNEVGDYYLLTFGTIYLWFIQAIPAVPTGISLLFDHGLVLWEVIWGIMTSIFGFTTVILVLVCVKLLNFTTLIEE